MADHVRQARAILAVYLERGRTALLHFSVFRDDEAAELLRLRTAAFHNFRAADNAAADAGIDLATDPEIRTLLQELAVVHAALPAALTAASVRCQVFQQKLREARRALGGYLSGPADAGSFTHPA